MFAEESKATESIGSTSEEEAKLETSALQKEPIGIPALEALQQHFDSGLDKKF